MASAVVEDLDVGLEQSYTESDERLQGGASAVTQLVGLLTDPERLYRQAPDSGRRLLNQAVFDRIYIDFEEVVDDQIRPPFDQFVRLSRRYGPLGRVRMAQRCHNERSHPRRGGISIACWPSWSIHRGSVPIGHLWCARGDLNPHVR